MSDLINKTGIDIERIVSPEEAYENYIPDQLFPTESDWEIPVLDDSMQATEVAIPFLCYGEQKRTLDLQGNGTVHFFY